jgi:hypothetical protein
MLKEIYGLDLDRSASHLLKEKRTAVTRKGADR